MTTQTTSKTYGLSYWIAQTLKTRRYGFTYIHVGAREAARASFCAYVDDASGILFRFRSYGRSLSSGGHKYKVHARKDGKPVPTKVLKTL
jgi:hypothetical protein